MKPTLKAIQCADGYIIKYTHPMYAYSKEHVYKIAKALNIDKENIIFKNNFKEVLSCGHGLKKGE